MRCNAGTDGFVAVSSQIAGCNGDTEHAIRVNRARIRGVVDRQGNHVARFEFAFDFARDGDGALRNFTRVEDVVCSDGVNAENRRGASWRNSVNGIGALRGDVARVARCIVRHDAGGDEVAGQQISLGNVFAKQSIRIHLRNVCLTVHGKYDGVACSKFAGHSTRDRQRAGGDCAGFSDIDDVVSCDRVNCEHGCDGIRARGVNHITVISRDGRGVVIGIVRDDRGVDFFGAIVDQGSRANSDAVNTIHIDGTTEVLPVYGQRHLIASSKAASHFTGDGDGGGCRFKAVNDVVCGDLINAQHGRRRHSVNAIAVNSGNSTHVVRGVMCRHAGGNDLACIRRQISRGDVDGEFTIGVDGAREWFVVDGECDDIAHFELAGDLAGDRCVDNTRFRDVDDVVCCHRINAKDGAGVNWTRDVNDVGALCRDRRNVACVVVCSDAAVDQLGAVSAEVCGGNSNRVSAICGNRTREWFVVDGESHDVTVRELANHLTRDGDGGVAGFGCVDDVVCRDFVDHQRGVGWTRCVNDVLVINRNDADVVGHIMRSDCDRELFETFSRQINRVNRNTEGATGIDIARERVLIDREGDNVTRFKFTRDFAGDHGARCCRLSRIDDVVNGNWIDADAGGASAGSYSVNQVVVVGGDGAHVVRSVRRRHGDGGDGVWIIHQVSSVNVVDGESPVGVDGACFGVAIHHHRDDVARLEFTCHPTCDGGGGVAGLGRIDDVVCRHRVNDETGGLAVWSSGINHVAVQGRDGAGHARQTVRNNSGFDLFTCIGKQVSRGNADAENTTGVDIASKDGVIDDERDNIVVAEIAGDLARDGRVGRRRFCGVDGVIRRDSVEVDGHGFSHGDDGDRFRHHSFSVARFVGEDNLNWVFAVHQTGTVCTAVGGCCPVTVFIDGRGEFHAIDGDLDSGAGLTRAMEGGFGIAGDAVVGVAARVVGGIVRQATRTCDDGIDDQGMCGACAYQCVRARDHIDHDVVLAVGQSLAAGIQCPVAIGVGCYELFNNSACTPDDFDAQFVAGSQVGNRAFDLQSVVIGDEVAIAGTTVDRTVGCIVNGLNDDACGWHGRWSGRSATTAAATTQCGSTDERSPGTERIEAGSCDKKTAQSKSFGHLAAT